MKKIMLSFLILQAFLTSCSDHKSDTKTENSSMPISPPVAKKQPRKSTEHGHERIDNYFWLVEKENPEVIKHLEAENAYAEKIMEGTKEVQEKLFKEMKARIKEEDSDVPTLSNGYYYQRETKTGQQYAIISRTRNAKGSQKEIILDGNEMAEGKETFLMGNLLVSRNNELLAYATNYTGSYMQYTLQFLNLNTNKLITEKIENVNSFAWANDNKTIFYTICDEALRPYRVYKHLLGSDPEADQIVFEEKDELFNVGLSKDKKNKYLLIQSESFTSSETSYLDADHPEGKFKVFSPRNKDIRYSVETYEKGFFILYKDEENKNFKVMLAPSSGFEKRESWKDFVAHDPKIKIEEIQVFEKYLVLSTRSNGLEGIRVIDLATSKNSEVLFPEQVYAINVFDNPEYSSHALRYRYSSLNRSATFYEYDFQTKVSTKLKEVEIPSGFKPEDYQVERLFAPAADGTQVPVSLVYKKGFKKDGTHPMYLTGYGSYGISNDARFNRDMISLLDRGFAYCIAHIRGGSDLGEQWYEDGKLFKKKNTFTDFIACAEFLIKQKYTVSERLAIEGGSAGGLLMGAAVNLRPDLFKVVVADVPFVDMMNTMLDSTLPLTIQEYEQWGNPNEKAAYEYMLSYSPYDNVITAAYPNILAVAGLNDSQVGYHEAAKWIAKLRDFNTNKNSVLLLKTNMASGHGGASGRFDYLKEVAFEYAFILDKLGMVKE